MTGRQGPPVVRSARWDGVRLRKGGNECTSPGPLVKILARFEETPLQSKRAKRRLSLDFGFDAGGCRSRRVLRRGGVNHLQPNSVSQFLLLGSVEEIYFPRQATVRTNFSDLLLKVRSRPLVPGISPEGAFILAVVALSPALRRGDRDFFAARERWSFGVSLLCALH